MLAGGSGHLITEIFLTIAGVMWALRLFWWTLCRQAEPSLNCPSAFALTSVAGPWCWAGKETSDFAQSCTFGNLLPACFGADVALRSSLGARFTLCN